MSPILTILVLTTSDMSERSSLDEVEKAFWECEARATREYIDAYDAIACSEIYEQLKIQKFSGDFERLLAWWRQNKNREGLPKRELK